jgi:predicted transcriptional regulator
LSLEELTRKHCPETIKIIDTLWKNTTPMSIVDVCLITGVDNKVVASTLSNFSELGIIIEDGNPGHYTLDRTADIGKSLNSFLTKLNLKIRERIEESRRFA